MKLVKFDTPVNNPLWVNPDQVIAIEAGKVEGMVRIYVCVQHKDGAPGHLVVSGTPEDVAAALMKS